MWVFPHKSHTNIGIFFEAKDIGAGEAKKILENFLKEKKYNFSGFRPEAAVLNFDYQGCVFGNVFLAGEAAGLTFRTTGEGIAPALISGREVGMKILDPEYKMPFLKKILKIKKRQEFFKKLSDLAPFMNECFLKVFAKLMKIKRFQIYFEGAPDFFKTKNYFSFFLKLPYTLNVLISILGWAFLCVMFGFFLILSHADFEQTGTRDLFVFSFFICVAFWAFIVGTEYGLLRPLGIKESRKELRVLNDNIKNGRLVPGISVETLKEIFASLSSRPKDWIRATEFGSLIVLSVLLIETIAGGMVNFFIILASGAIAVLILVMFAGFFAERFVFSVLKECREELIKKGERIKEKKSPFNSIRIKLFFSLLVPLIIVVAVLSFIVDLKSLKVEILIFPFIGLVMAAILSNLIFSSVYRSFLEIKDFSKNLSKGKKTFFSTGSVDSEILDMSASLNSAAKEVYNSKISAEKAAADLQERIEELQRFYNLTIGRELRMAELKEQIKRIEGELKKLKRQNKI